MMSKAGESKIHVSTDIETKAIALQKLDIDVQLTILDAVRGRLPLSSHTLIVNPVESNIAKVVAQCCSEL